MTPAMTLWSHALGALLFGMLAALAFKAPPRRRPLAVALAMTGVAALALAGLGVSDPGTALAQGLRDGCWIVGLVTYVGRRRAGHPALAAMAASVAGAALLSVGIGVAETLPEIRRGAPALFAASHALRAVALAGGLLLVHAAAGVARRAGDAPATGVVAAVGVLWAGEFAATAAAWALGGWAGPLVVFRGAALLVAGTVAGAALVHRRGTPLSPSRQIGWALLAGGAVAAYAVAVASASGYAAQWGAQGRIVQVALVVGAGAALTTLVATPWLRAWARVKLAKHLFGHRYDYRAEWLRFTAALAGQEPLPERVVRALAGFTDSPGGLLLIADDGRLLPDAGWHWTQPMAEAGAVLAARMAEGWVVELDRLREDQADPAERAAVPDAWIDAEQAWAAVPLVHDGALVAAVLLARPPVAHPLDWEDFDLLRLAGRQAASHLAEDRARAALAEARRFDEFNRRFAFIMHDLKNLVSQMTLTASNARRHADNAEFRADMVATLGDCADRMTALIARLQSHGEQPPEPLTPVDCVAAARRVARRFGHHPVEVAGDAGLALAHAQRFEQLLAHLVQNAAEASPADAPVTIAVGHEGERMAVSVIDRGTGMTPGFIRDELFRPFASSKSGGFGLGAFEARQLVLGMGGTLEVDSRHGEGSRFRILLPVTPALEVAA